MMKPAMAGVLVLLGQCAITTAHARANEESAHSVLVVVSASDRLVEPAKKAAEQAVAAQSWRVVSVKPAIVKALAQCTLKNENRCLKKPFGQIRADVVLIIRAKESRGDDGEPRVILDGALFDPATVKVLRSTQRHCLRCHGTGRLSELAGNLATELIRGQSADLAPYTKLKVITTPSDATMFVDDTRVGMAGRSYQVPPGPVTFRVERAGYESVTREVQLKPNQELVLSIELVSTKKNTTRTPTPRRRYSVWGVGTAGVLSLAVGVRWLAIDRGVTGGDEQNPTSRSVQMRGVVAVGVGTALVGAAALLWYRSRRSRGSRVSIAPTPSGVAVIWRGQF